MKRLCIFSIYDPEGLIDEYVMYYISQLDKVCDFIVMTFNGKLEDSEIRKVQRKVDSIVIRDNVGFDAGAYKEVILDLYERGILEEYDELVLCNDTIYGPFVPIQVIFEDMESRECDFWGILPWDENYISFISSFFLVYRKPILEDINFYSYLRNCINEKSTCIADAYGLFEMGLFKMLRDKGYKWDCYSKVSIYHCMKTPDIMISDYNFPFLKRRAFCPEHYHEANLCAALSMIKDCGYDTKMILDNASRRYKISDKILQGDFSIENMPERYTLDYSDITPQDIIDFINEHSDKDVYVYGAGAFGSRICVEYRQYAKHFKGFAVTKSDGIKRVNESVTSIGDIDIDQAAFIVGIDRKNTKEVMETSLKGAPYVLTLFNDI